MFNFSWSEIALIVAVALIAIGPKDLPGALKTMAQVVKKARGMASEFQGHVNELMREADLDDVRKQINEIRNFDFKGEVERAIDPDHSIRDTFNESPFAAADAAALSTQGAESLTETAIAEPIAPAFVPEPEEPEEVLAAPSFVPPAVVAAMLAPPSFVPPDLLSSRS